MAEPNSQPILHVVVVGFHHKKGCQVEYAYPPMIEGQPVDSHEVPLVWKHLPSLALPDGAHNSDKDTVYFHLPAQDDKNTTVYGVSCYRQIDAKDILNKSSEITRNSVQKCVCVLSRLPLYGVIEAKLEMITYAWFSEKDFSQVALLEETYRQLCASCNHSMLEGSQVFHGLSCRDLVLRYKHNLVLLFKLILLERKVLVYGSPVKPVCTMLISMLSVFPGELDKDINQGQTLLKQEIKDDMVEYGLKESAAYDAVQQVSTTLRNVSSHSKSEEDFLEIHYTNDFGAATGGADSSSICNNQGDDSNKVQVNVGGGGENSLDLDLTRSIVNYNVSTNSSFKDGDKNRNSHGVNNNNNTTIAESPSVSNNKHQPQLSKSSQMLKLDPEEGSGRSRLEGSQGSLSSASPGSGGTTPCGGVKEKAENEKQEKDTVTLTESSTGAEISASQNRNAFVVDSKICGERVNERELGVDSMTRLESSSSERSQERELGVDSMTRMESSSSERSQGDEVILEDCKRISGKTDPLEFVEDITHIEHVQSDTQLQAAEGLAFSGEDDIKVTPISPLLSTFGNQPDVVTAHVQKDISDDNLATTNSEGTASDFGTSYNMEELLDTEEEGLEWGDDKLLLAINSELGSPIEPFEREKRIERTDSTASWASHASSVASDLGEASVKVMSDIKSKFSYMWDQTQDGAMMNKSDSMDSATEPMTGVDEEIDSVTTSEGSDSIRRVTSLPQVHSTGHHNDSESSKGSKSSSPAKSPLGTPQKESADNSVNMCLPPVTPTTLKLDECGFPMAVFTKGVLCHPYLSLQYYDILQDVNVRGFLIGASNMLFKQKRNLLDAIIEIETMKIDIPDEILRRQLTLTTADLRFAEYLVKSVMDEKGVFLDETEWEGGDEWLRGQFKLYLASLLITIQKGDEKLQEDFNLSFVQAYKTTNSYRVWISAEHRGLKEAPPGHPFHGQMSMQDVKMKFALMMGSTEKGKRIMAAAGSTGKVAVQTGKAIGGAISSAKSAVSGTVTGWFSSIKKWSSSDSPLED